MPLIRLEVQDFKSYRSHQIIGPFQNFSCVIGPNGSGKSNVMDALSFALGLKSSQLRSTQLKDLIYRGRRMTDDDDDEEMEGEGTAKTAWVMAVYQDAKGQEYRFQRIISLNGNSEYRLNGRAVTYAQYNAQLEQHNILVKAKNFLVFQGDVEAVASQSSKDLSKLIDQISGSLEHKEEYEKAKAAQERAIENSTFNFNKRRGINSELKQFREQKSEADKFEKLQRERDAHTLQYLIWRLYHIEDGIKTNVERVNGRNEELAGIRSKQREHDVKVNDARKEQAQAHKDVMKQEKAIKHKERDLEDKRPALDALDERLSHSVRKLKNAETLSEQVQKDLDKQTASLQKLQKDYDTVKKAADRAQEEQRKVSQSAGLTLDDNDLNTYHELKAQANLRAVSERQQLETLRRDERIKKAAVQGLQDKLDQFTRQREKLQGEQETLTERKRQLDAKHKELETGLDSTKTELTTSQNERTRINKRETELNETLQSCYNKLLQAGHDQKESEREAKMKETFATLQKIFPGVRGRVVDLCKPTQRKYDTAVSTVLGRNIDSVIVDQEKTAIDCIEYLRNQRAGQATFIPLDTIQVKPINDRLRSIAKGVRLAIDVIQFDPAIERAIQHACGNALVCDTMEIARFVCYDKQQEVKAVTLEGTVIHKSGLITGGASGQSGGRRWEERELQGLHRQRDQCLADLKELQKEKRAATSDDALSAEIGHLESELTTVRDDLNATNRRLTGIQDELKHMDKEIKGTAPKLSNTKKEHEQLRTQVERLEAVVNREEDSVFANFCRRIGVANIREYEERQLKIMQQQSEARLQFDSQMARLTHQSNFEKEQIASTQDRLRTLERATTKEREVIETVQEEKEELQAENDAIGEEIEELNTQLTALKEEYYAKTAALDEVKKTASKTSKMLEASLKEISTWNDEIEKLGSERTAIYRKCRLEEIELPLVSGSLDDVPLEENAETAPMDFDDDGTQRPLEVPDYDLEVDFSELDEEEKENGGADMAKELQERIDKANAEIERMTPNMKAMERLEDTEAKLAETEKEFEKSRREAKTARDEFNRIKKLRCDKFNKAYNHISERIDQVYKDLTKGKASPMGGVAYLSLEDTEEPYLSGIKYHAMPPMKRFRDMDQLSGGEKTMAALALLFAIHSYQPSPFFVLDEVDAALDTQNVAKVSNYIRQHAKSSFQFIVISLKATLYERSQALVGIYRDQEKNSSATLTLDLERYA